MPHNPSCIFCKIVRGEIPSARILETDACLAFLDINPVNLGHLLLIPKDHHVTLADLPPDTAAALGRALPALCRAVQKATNAPAYNVIVNNGARAGQVVYHVHYHVIPRLDDDNVRWPWPHVAYAEGGMAAMQNAITSVLEIPSA